MYPFRTLIFLLLLVLLAACSGGKAEATATPTLDPGPQQTGTAGAVQDQQATQAAEQTAAAVSTAQAVQTADAQATLDAEATQQAQSTMDAQATQTAKYVAIQAAKTESAAKFLSTQSAATAIAQPMSDLAIKLLEDGAVTSSAGKLYQIDDFDESWAQMNWYRWWPTGYDPERYIVKTHVKWTSASETANWFNSGCGFVFDADDNDNHFFVFLGLDGYATINRQFHGVWSTLVRKYIGKQPIPSGEADFILAVEDDFVTFIVNDEVAAHAHDSQIHKGPLALTLISGTNKDFGTRCEMSDIYLWELN